MKDIQKWSESNAPLFNPQQTKIMSPSPSILKICVLANQLWPSFPEFSFFYPLQKCCELGQAKRWNEQSKTILN